MNLSRIQVGRMVKKPLLQGQIYPGKPSIGMDRAGADLEIYWWGGKKVADFGGWHPVAKYMQYANLIKAISIKIYLESPHI